jgi:hypothetical protein
MLPRFHISLTVGTPRFLHQIGRDLAGNLSDADLGLAADINSPEIGSS